MSKQVHHFKPTVEQYAALDADAAMYRERAKFWKGKSIAIQVRERIESVHSPVIGDPWNLDPDLSQTTLFAY